MKCIALQNTPGKIVRVSDEQAEMLVESNKAKYVGKQMWKAMVRDAK